MAHQYNPDQQRGYLNPNYAQLYQQQQQQWPNGAAAYLQQTQQGRVAGFPGQAQHPYLAHAGNGSIPQNQYGQQIDARYAHALHTVGTPQLSQQQQQQQRQQQQQQMYLRQQQLQQAQQAQARQLQQQQQLYARQQAEEPQSADEEEPDDEADEDFRLGRARPRAAGQRPPGRPPPRPAANTPSRARRRYEEEDESDEEEEDEAFEEDDEFRVGKKGQGPRPRRAAAQHAAQQMKNSFVESEGEEEEDQQQPQLQYFDAKPKPAPGYAPVQRLQQNGWAAPVRQPTPPSQQQRVSYRDDEEEEYSGSEAEEAERRALVAKRNAAVAALLDEAETREMDDEVERVLGHRPSEEAEEVPGDKWASMEFWVKWKRWSYRHCSWDTLTTLSQLGGYKRVLNYCKKQDEIARQRGGLSREEQELQDVERQMEEQLVQEHMEIERVVALRKDSDGKVRYLCKWRGLPYAEATWETVDIITEAGAVHRVDDYQERQMRLNERPRSVDQARGHFLSSGTRSLLEQPEWLRGGGKLRDYQLDGLNWLIYSWAKDHNSILADEMGLGKTVQCVSMIGYLAMSQKVMGPFLIVVPLSTVPNWIKEFNKWLPQVNTLVYVGDSKSREVIRTFEFDNKMGANNFYRPNKFEVIITTYELVLKDAAVLGRIRWNYLVVDEAHRLKNNESALYQELAAWSFRNKLLVTGTPLQNSLKELWALLHFLEPHKFPSCSYFEAHHSLTSAEGVTQLHAELKPHLLRRVIKDVERSLPPKRECILRVEMTPLQKQYYKYILSRNYRELNKGSGPQISLLNIIIELKKCCNHPFLFATAEEDYRGNEGDQNAVDRLVLTSGKMVLLDKLMRSLKQNGHRVLIFSQMVRALDIISDYMRLRGYQHQRLDGSTPAATRHQAMEHFNAPGSTDFAFLLSTRAGGLGINLATADTVIIFDSDWNPQNDLQAMSRAHRIGQTETVNIYRFLTSGSVEEDILQRAKQKMVLDHLVIQRMDTSGRTVLDASGANTAKKMFGKDELAAILRFGAEELFKEDETKREQRQNQMLHEDIDSILARAEVVTDTDQPTDGGELLSSFNVATFKAEEDDTAFWNRLIPVQERAKDEPELPFEDLGMRSTRHKATDDYDGRDDTPGSGPESDSGSEGVGRRRRRGSTAGKQGLGTRRTTKGAGPPVDGSLSRVDIWPSDCGPDGQPLPRQAHERVKKLSRRDAGAFVRAVRRFARLERMADIVAEVGSVLQDSSETARNALWWALLKGCEKVERMAADQKKDVKDALLDWFGVGVKAQEITQLVARMSLLSKRIEAVKDPERQFRMDEVTLSMPKWGAACDWGTRDDAMLLLGCYWYGIGKWDEMARDERLRLGEKLALAATEKKGKDAKDVDPMLKHLPKGSHIETRALALLRKMQTVAEKATVERSKPARLSGRKRTAPMMATRMHHNNSVDDPDGCEALLGDEIMINVKKLRVLQRKGDEMERQKVVEKTRKYLVSVGERIRAISTADRMRKKLWQFVSRFTENKMDGDKLEQVFKKIKSGRAATVPIPSGRGAGMDVGGSGAQGEDGRDGEELADGDVKAEMEEGEEEPPARRPRHEDWDGGTTPPVWHNQRSRTVRAAEADEEVGQWEEDAKPEEQDAPEDEEQAEGDAGAGLDAGEDPPSDQ